MIKYNVKTVNDWLYNSNPIKKLYYNGTMRYRRFVANGSPTPPTPPSFDGKFKAEYSNGTSYSAACDGNTSLTTATTKPSGYRYTAMTSCEIGQCVTSIGNSAFDSCNSLSSVTLGNSVITIGDYAFQACYALTSVTIPDSVIYLNLHSFYQCISLTEINLPDSVISIGEESFRDCRSMTSCTIGSGITSIANLSFYNCRSLSSVIVNAIVPPTLVGNYVFKNTNDCPIYVPDESVDAYKTANRWSSYASRIKPISEKPQ